MTTLPSVLTLFGVCWVLIVFRPFISLVCATVGYDTTADITQDPNAASRINFALCAFHTAFNLCNVLILVWFIKLFEKVVCKIIRGREEDEDMRLKFISACSSVRRRPARRSHRRPWRGS